MESQEEHSPPISIACAADGRFAAPLAAMVRSLIENLRGDRSVIIHVLDGGIGAGERRRAISSWDHERVEIDWRDGPLSEARRFKHWNSFGPTTYFRLLLPDVLPGNVQRAIFLDCDILVLADIGDLWETDLGGRPLGAVEDLVLRRMEHGLLGWQELGLDPAAKYFNAGVLLMDLDLWRRERIGQKALEAIERDDRHFRWQDQDALNATLAGRWRELDPLWNVGIEGFWPRSWRDSPYAESEYNALIDRARIVHFCGAPKPWAPGSTHPRRDLYFRYLDRTAWAGWRPPPVVQLPPAPPPR